MVPKSMGTTDGQPLPLRDKAKILHENELSPLQEHSNSVDHVHHNLKKVILIDRIALVNSVHKHMDGKLHFKKDALKFLKKVFILGVLQKRFPGVWAKFLNKIR